VLILFIVGGVVYFKFNNYTYKKDEKNIAIKQKPKTYQLDGVLTEGTMNTITVKQANGTIYSFSTVGVSMSKVDGLIIGIKLHIKYYGVLDKSKDIQSGKIKDIYSVVDKNAYPLAWNDDGIFSAYYQKAYEKLKTLTKEEKVGQLLLARIPETNQVEDIQTYHLGGYILFGRDTKDKTKDQLINMVASYQDVSKIPLLIATDEEGGIVVRISNNPNLSSSRFKSSQDLYREGGFDLINNDTVNKSNLLYSLGINVNLAPVSDVSTNSNDYIYQRSFGQDGNQTAIYVKTVVTASKGLKVSYVLKHFPGYGNNVNTHTGIAIDKRSYDTFKNSDFLPFESGINSGAEAILVSHNIVNCIDSTTPASLSVNVHNILRDDLKFTGIIMTDDLAMDAIKDYVPNPYVKAILSGNDLLIVSDYKTAYSNILAAMNDGTISEQLIDQLTFKVLAWKYYKWLL
jgi:beta-N-acetylhexosaminidase